jgi:ribosomal protein S18 acetylase RimI-like enzyme
VDAHVPQRTDVVEVNAASQPAQTISRTAIAVRPLSHQEPAVAAQIHAVMMLAYAQEAALLQVKHFVPLEKAVTDLQASAEFYVGAFAGDTLVGSISLGPDDEPDQLCIHSLVVHPNAQRQGIGRALVADVLRRAEGVVVAVATAELNAPALALYQAFGFVPYKRGEIGPERLALLKLRRAAVHTPLAHTEV